MELSFSFDGQTHAVAVDHGGYLSGATLSPEGEARVRALLALTAEARAFAAGRLLDTHNGTWAEEGAPPLSAAEFAGRMRFTSLHIFDNPGAADMCFDDGDLFWGHTIVVSLQGSQFRDAAIFG